MKRSTITTMVVILLGIGAVQAQAATYTVNTLGDAGDFTCDATCTLRDAIAEADQSDGSDTIEFSVTGTIILTRGRLFVGDNGTLTINGPGADQLTISGNNASSIFLIGSAPATVEINGVTISGGNSSTGAGIYIEDGTLTLNNSTVRNNSASASGGGIFNGFFCTLTLNNSTVRNNSASSGGGISNVGTLTLNNSTVSSNSASFGGGGGISNASGESSPTLNLNNSTVSNNSAANFGGGIFSQGGTLTLNNSIIANSSGADCTNLATTGASYTLVEDGSCGVTSGNNGNLTGDPNLGPLQNNGGSTETHALLAGSPAIDAGSDLLIPVGITTDQRGTGFARIFGAAVDMGAFEVQSPPDADGDGVSDADDVCSGTVLPEDEPLGLKKNRFYANELGDLIDADGISAGITVADTGGCSGSQIITAAGLGSGHVRFGITRSALEAWIASLP